MSRYETLQESLRLRPRTWLVTGAAGFIGSHLVETLLRLGQRVKGLDNLATGRLSNLEDVRREVGEPAWNRFEFIEGDIRSLETCAQAMTGVYAVLHQAALGSVPRSIQNPIASHQSNVDGFLNMLWAAKEQGIRNFVFASSSSVYGDDPRVPKVEAQTGLPLSPYALTKSINEQYARVFRETYGLKSCGLRYFNVFGPRQNPAGPYAAVIPRWIKALMREETCSIFGDGETSRDFCYVANAVQANLLAASLPPEVEGGIFNVSYGGKTSLTALYALIRKRVATTMPSISRLEAEYLPTRPGDIRDSQADLTRTSGSLGYAPTHSVIQGLDHTVPWFLAHPES
jgi:UDP-N-acetylglucosamine 4-epimerase